MNPASTTSPFVTSAEDEPWLVWQKSTPLTTLYSNKQTDSRYAFEADAHEEPPYQPILPSYKTPPIQRAQYNAVLNRISQATHRTGQYSPWST